MYCFYFSEKYNLFLTTTIVNIKVEVWIDQFEYSTYGGCNYNCCCYTLHLSPQPRLLI